MRIHCILEVCVLYIFDTYQRSSENKCVFDYVISIEPYTFVTTDPASVGDFIRYADFQIDTKLESLNDEVTVEAEPNMDVINNLLQVNSSLNETFHVIPQGN